MTQVVVLPYYLFNGTLVERITRQVEHLKQQYPTIRFIATTYFGFETEIFEVLELRVRDLQSADPIGLMPCDGCKYRSFAEEHGMGGHHHDDAMGHDHSHEHPHAHPAAPAYLAITRQPLSLIAAGKTHTHQHGHDHEHGHTHKHEHSHESK
jgi:sirohydrochlorin cobaltochelatase